MTGPWPIWIAIVVLLASAGVTVIGGVRMSQLGDVLADRTKIGEAIFGAVFFGAMISLSGIVMTATAAADGFPRLAFSNAIGGVAAQTAALGVADLAYRHANLEHAAASVPNMLFAALLVALLSLVLIISESPSWTLWGIHPGSLALVAAYLYGLRVVRRSGQNPFWLPVRTRQTIEDVPHEEDARGRSTVNLFARFLFYGTLVAAGGWAVARATTSLVERTTLGESLAGAAIMGVTNALPEMVTSVAAVRRGAVTLAVGGVLGGNAFDVLNVAIGDAFFRGGSLYHAAGSDEHLLTLVSILMTALILAGLLARERRGPGNIGFEGISMLAVYFAALALIAFR